MGITNLYILIDPEAKVQVSRKGYVSQHIVVENTKKYVFGWDQPLSSFYLQVHDLVLPEEDNRIIVWLGATKSTIMYEVEDLVRMARRHGIRIPYPTQVELHREKDNGQ